MLILSKILKLINLLKPIKSKTEKTHNVRKKLWLIPIAEIHPLTQSVHKISVKNFTFPSCSQTVWSYSEDDAISADKHNYHSYSSLIDQMYIFTFFF